LYSSLHHLYLHSFPTRRSSDLYTYIGDVIQGTMAALKYEGPRYDIFNLGESETIQLKELISMLENALGKKAKINRLSEQPGDMRSEEHTSELQSRFDLVCRLLL